MTVQEAVLGWLAGFASAFCLKLSSSIDDVVWLAPFLTSNSSIDQRIKNASIYITVCMIQTVVAMVLAYSGDEFVEWLTADEENAWSSEKILTVAAGAMLAIYSVKLTYECIEEMNEGDDSDDDEDKSDTGEHSTNDSVRNLEEAESKKKKGHGDAEDGRSQTLFVISFIGSVDDLTLFVPMLVGKGFDIVQLVSGGFLATLLIVSICVFIGLCKPVADCLSKIPLAAIVIVFATVLLTRSFFMK